MKVKIAQEPAGVRVTENCTVTLKSTIEDVVRKVRISQVNGYTKYKFLIGKKRGAVVKVDGSSWCIDYIQNDKKKKRAKRKYSLLSHSLNNSTHFIR